MTSRKLNIFFGEKDQLKKENKKDKGLFNLHVMRLLYLILPHKLSLSFLVGHISQIHHRESLPKIHHEYIFHIESARVIPYYKTQVSAMYSKVFHIERAKVSPYYKIRVSAFAVNGVWFTVSAVGFAAKRRLRRKKSVQIRQICRQRRRIAVCGVNRP